MSPPRTCGYRPGRLAEAPVGSKAEFPSTLSWPGPAQSSEFTESSAHPCPARHPQEIRSSLAPKCSSQNSGCPHPFSLLAYSKPLHLICSPRLVPGISVVPQGRCCLRSWMLRNGAFEIHQVPEASRCSQPQSWATAPRGASPVPSQSLSAPATDPSAL